MLLQASLRKIVSQDDKGMKVAGEMLELYRVVETQSQALQIESYTFIYISISRVAYMLFKQRP